MLTAAEIVPIGASALLSAKLVKDAKLKIYKGGSHGICIFSPSSRADDSDHVASLQTEPA